jgi:hypothetical protein
MRLLRLLFKRTSTPVDRELRLLLTFSKELHTFLSTASKLGLPLADLGGSVSYKLGCLLAASVEDEVLRAAFVKRWSHLLAHGARVDTSI